MSITPSIRVRQLVWEKTDIDPILEIRAFLFQQIDAYSEADFDRWCHFNPDLCIVAEVDGHIAGYLILRILAGVGDLASLAISPGFRRRGIGVSLVDEIERRVKAYGVGEIHLEVRSTNLPGQAFWKDRGFVPFGKLPGFYEDGGDAIQMKRILNLEG